MKERWPRRVTPICEKAHLLIAVVEAVVEGRGEAIFVKAKDKSYADVLRAMGSDEKLASTAVLESLARLNEVLLNEALVPTFRGTRVESCIDMNFCSAGWTADSEWMLVVQPKTFRTLVLSDSCTVRRRVIRCPDTRL